MRATFIISAHSHDVRRLTCADAPEVRVAAKNRKSSNFCTARVKRTSCERAFKAKKTTKVHGRLKNIGPVVSKFRKF